MKKLLFFTISIFFIASISIFAQKMESSHYYISRDSINSFGDENSTSANYILSDTGGELATGFGDSSSYTLHAGFRQFEEYRMDISCSKNDINLTPVRLTGKSALHNNYVDCDITTNNPDGYTFQWQTVNQDELLQQVDSSFKIQEITNNVPADWPAVLTDGTGWGGHLGTESDNFDSVKWGSSNDYDALGGKWAALKKDFPLEIITRSIPTDSDGDKERIYFGMEVDANTVIPPGEYEADIQFTVLPVF